MPKHKTPGLLLPPVRRLAAFTMAEMSIAVLIMSLVFAAVASLQYLSARTIKDISGPMKSRSSRMLALNNLRFFLADGQIGSCVVSNDGHTIEYHDPNLGAGVTSRFAFDTDSDALTFDDNIDDATPPREFARGFLDVTFTLGATEIDPISSQTLYGQQAVVTLYVKTSDDLAYSQVEDRDGETVVYLRNPPSN